MSGNQQQQQQMTMLTWQQQTLKPMQPRPQHQK
jgi:hypothetical protein